MKHFPLEIPLKCNNNTLTEGQLIVSTTKVSNFELIIKNNFKIFRGNFMELT